MITVTDGTFQELVLNSERPVLTDFWAEWCPPCKAVSRTLEDLAPEFSEQIVFAKINADDNPAIARKYSVLSLPTLFVFRQGEVVARSVGSRPKSYLRDMLGAHIA